MLYKTELETKLSSVQTDLQNQCNNNVKTPPDVVLDQTVTFRVLGDKVCITVIFVIWQKSIMKVSNMS